MSVTDYQLAKAPSDTPDGLSRAVRTLIQQGWQPTGQPVTVQGSIVQAMIQGTPDGGGLPAGSVAVANGDSIDVVSGNLSLTTGTAVVAEGVVGVDVGTGQALVTNGSIIQVSNSSSSQTVSASLDVAGGVPSVALDTTVALVANAATVAVVNSAGADSHNGTSALTAGNLTHVALAATTALVDNADVVAVENSAGGDSHNATATVTAGVLSNLKLAATVALVDNGDAIAVHNSAGTVIAGSHTAEVAAGVVTDLKLAATVAGVTNAQALTGVAPTGAYTSTVTFAVTNGVITGIALS